MHFKLDENIPVSLIKTIQEEGFDASSVFSQGLSGKTDRELMAHCRRKKLILITLDNDFSHTLIYPPKECAGIIVLRPKSQGIHSVIVLFRKCLSRFPLKEAENKTLIVDEKYVKVRE
ncbi:MAG: DUF5615 family PIN-like protein [Candidatus Diapherotrites archaeon]|nr:DUF5615 family PIN-like protein [Candidatus Diapherotrites archaeon]